MSNDDLTRSVNVVSASGMMLLTVSGVTPGEFFKRFGEVAQRFGYVLGPAAEAIREAEFNLPEAVTIGKGGVERDTAPSTALMAVQAADGEQPKRRVRRTRAQIEADRAAALMAPERDLRITTIAPDAFTRDSASPPLTIADVKLAGGRLLQANNGDPAPLRALLATYGVVRMTPLPEEHWAEFISKCDQWR